jgi:broad-specificity NMP kinase
MVIEKRGLIPIGKNYCNLISFLNKEKIIYYESESFKEIIVDLDEFINDTDKSITLSNLYLEGFISYMDKETALKHSLNKIVFWR